MNPGSVLLAALVLAPGLAAATPAGSETPPVIRWAIDQQIVTCTRVGYEVDVYGGTAVGTLTHACTCGGEDDVSGRFQLTMPPALEVLGVALASRGSLSDLAVEAVAVEAPKPARTPRGAKPTVVPAAASLRSTPFEIPAGDVFEVRTRFRVPLSVERGTFGLTLPPVEQETSGGAPRPVLSSVILTVHHDAPLLATASSTHEILSDFQGDRTIIEPVVREFPASQAFSVTFATGSEKDPTIAGRVRRDGESGHTIEIVLDPPREPEKKASRAKQVVFVVDTSGSMSAQDKLEQARRAVGRALASLQPSDRFNVIEFDDDFTLLRPAPMAPVAEGDDSVTRWLHGLKAEGGTRLLPALAAALDQPDDPERHGVLVVVTDGMLADETPVLELLKERLGERRLFVVGTGPGLRQETLLRLAEYGRGAAAFFGEKESLEQAVGELFDSISDPLAWDLKVDWDGGDVTEIEPSRLPDLYAGRPVRVLAHVRGDLPSSLGLRVSTVDGERRYRVSLPPVE